MYTIQIVYLSVVYLQVPATVTAKVTNQKCLIVYLSVVYLKVQANVTLTVSHLWHLLATGHYIGLLRIKYGYI